MVKIFQNEFINNSLPVDHSEKDLRYRVNRAAKLAIISIVAVLGNILTLGIPLACRLISDYRNRDKARAIENIQIDHLYTAVNDKGIGSLNWTIETLAQELNHSDGLYFAEEVIHLRNQVYLLKEKRENGHLQPGSVEALYTTFQKLISDGRFLKIYREVEGQGSSAVRFIKALAQTFQTADVSGVLLDLAKEKLSGILPEKQSYTIRDTGDILSAYHERTTAFRRDSALQKFFWAVAHPEVLFHSWESNSSPEHYNPRLSNPSYAVHHDSFQINGERRSLRFLAGPTPFNDPVYREITSKSFPEVRFNIMDISKKHESVMIRNIEQVAEESNGYLKHALFGFVTKEKRGLLNPNTLNALIDGYKKALISEELLSDEEMTTCCTLSQELIQEANPTLDLRDVKTRHAALVIVDTMISLAILMKEKGQIDVSLACKQCYDRGPVHFSALLLFVRSLRTAEPLTQDELYRIAGLPLLRAPLGEGREQLREKLAVYQKFTEILGSRTDLLSQYTRKLICK